MRNTILPTQFTNRLDGKCSSAAPPHLVLAWVRVCKEWDGHNRGSRRVGHKDKVVMVAEDRLNKAHLKTMDKADRRYANVNKIQGWRSEGELALGSFLLRINYFV